MLKSFLLTIAGLLFITTSFSQSLAVNADGSIANSSSILDVKSTVKGLLIPRMSKTEKNAIASPATGLTIFQSSPDSIGYYYYNGSAWIWMPGADQLNNTAWRLQGNSGTNPAANFLGTTDNVDLLVRTNNTEKMRVTNTGRIGIGTATSPIGTTYGFEKLKLSGDANINDVELEAIGGGGFGPFVVFAKSNGVYSSGTRTIVNNGDQIGNLQFNAYDGVSYSPVSHLIVRIDGTPAANDLPSRMDFYTRPAGSGGPTQRMSITNAGLVGIGTGTPDASSQLQVFAANRGVLFPNVALTATNAAGPITSPANSLLVYNTATAGTAPNNVTPGYYYNSGTGAAPAWTRLENGGNDWHTTGNAGTAPATNFIGTTDAQDFVVKTAGSAAGNERMRLIGSGATPGQVVINNTGIFSGDVFSAYAGNTTNGTTTSINNSVGTFAINGYSSDNGTGVYGEVNQGATGAGSAIWGNTYGTATSASTTSEGVWGTNSTAPAGSGATAAVATAVRGDASGAAGTAFTMGVLGVNTAIAGGAYGVYGQTSSPNAMGVFGVNLDVSANPAHAIQGQTAAVGSAAGLRGFNTASAIGSSQNGFGV
ncbi:MAG: hypothetical protein ACKOU7_14165, partial [Ferruginibacter sp.]